MCQCDDDYRLLNKLITDSTEALGRKARITTWFKSGDGEGAPAPLPREQVRVSSFSFLPSFLSTASTTLDWSMGKDTDLDGVAFVYLLYSSASTASMAMRSSMSSVPTGCISS